MSENEKRLYCIKMRKCVIVIDLHQEGDLTWATCKATCRFNKKGKDHLVEVLPKVSATGLYTRKRKGC